MQRLAVLAVAIAALSASHLNAVETVVKGLVGSTTEVPIGVPTLNRRGRTTDNCALNDKNTTVITVNCIAEVATVKIVAPNIRNASGAPAVLLHDRNVNKCIAKGATGFINHVCGSDLESFEIFEAISESVAVYSFPINGRSTVTVTAVITNPEYIQPQ